MPLAPKLLKQMSGDALLDKKIYVYIYIYTYIYILVGWLEPTFPLGTPGLRRYPPAISRQRALPCGRDQADHRRESG